MKTEELKTRLREFRLGEPVRFSAGQDEPLVVERSLEGLVPCWIIDFRGERHVMKDVDDAAVFIARHTRPDFREMLSGGTAELGEIVDLGEY